MSRRRLVPGLWLALALHVLLSAVGLSWGLPSRSWDKFLFPDGDSWPADRTASLAGADEKLSPQRLSQTGADVDIDPLRTGEYSDALVLNATDADLAEILLRYRLYTYQPDEMITMMALAGMNPRRLKLDPRLYQYGGLFVYPVGALIAAGGAVGLIDLRRDLAYYLDHPEQFGRFYIAARLYAAAWGFAGIFLVYGIARAITREWSDGGRTAARHGGTQVPCIKATGAAGLAAVLFVLLPVVVCMSHEAKPHLPGAVLMLAAVWFAIRHVQRASRSIRDPEPPKAEGGVDGVAPSTRDRDFWLMCVSCGAAVGMVLSAAPIVVLIPLIVLMKPSSGRGAGPGRHIVRAGTGCVLAVITYLAANPYVLVNAFVNREVLRSNFGNSLAMYEITRIGEGLIRVLQLTVEGATLPVAVFGTIAFGLALVRWNRAAIVLFVPAAVFFLQFVLIGAGKPGEYGRFGVFTNSALAIAAACLLAAPFAVRRWLAVLSVMAVVAAAGRGATAYVHGFWLDARGRGTRIALAGKIAEFITTNAPPSEARQPAPPMKNSSTSDPGNARTPIVALLAEPAPYSCPPMDFGRVRLMLLRSPEQFPLDDDRPQLLINPVDHQPEVRGGWTALRHWIWPRETPISWANKPFLTRSTR